MAKAKALLIIKTLQTNYHTDIVPVLDMLSYHFGQAVIQSGFSQNRALNQSKRARVVTFTKYREGSKLLLLSLMISEVYEINMYLTVPFISLPDYSSPTEFGQSCLQGQLIESSQHTHLICIPACYILPSIFKQTCQSIYYFIAVPNTQQNNLFMLTVDTIGLFWLVGPRLRSEVYCSWLC